jgi:hypothetical protein
MIVTVEEFQEYTQDFNDSTLTETIIKAAQEIVENYIGYKLEAADYEEKKDFTRGYIAVEHPVIEINSLLVDGQAATGTSRGNIIKLDDYQAGTAEVEYSGGLDPVPDIIRLVVLQIATLKLMETGKKIGVTGIQNPDGAGSTFINYTNFDKYLQNLKQYRIL